MLTPPEVIGVIGGGAWGTALANAAAVAGRAVVLWLRDPEQAEAMQARRPNARHLPGVRLHDPGTGPAAPAALRPARAPRLGRPPRPTGRAIAGPGRGLAPARPPTAAPRGTS